MQPIPTVTLEAGRLTAALDNLADVAGAIERHADEKGPLEDPDAQYRHGSLIATRRRA